MGKRKHVNDLTVDTNSQCFICFKKVSRGFSSIELKGAESHDSSIHSLQCLSRYLKMDMRKMFHEEDSIPPHLLAQVQKSRLKVELCEDCGRMNETFSKQYKQLEKIEMEIESSLKLIDWKFQAAMESNNSAQFQNSRDDFNGKMEIANALRTEAMGKCKRKLRRPSLLVSIQNLSRRELMANQLKNSRPNPVEFPNLAHNLAKPKDEISILHPDPNDMEERDHFNDYQSSLHTSDVDFGDTESENADKTSNVPTMSNIRGAMQIIVVRGSEDGTPSAGARNEGKVKKYTINQETGKYKCNLCSMEFGKSGFEYHFKSIHLAIKYKCNLCDKVFSVRPAYNLHLKNIHKGLPSSFSVVTATVQPINEWVGKNHFRSIHLGIKYKCSLCEKEYSHRCDYNRHHKNVHKGMPSSFTVVTASEPPTTENLESSFNFETNGNKCDLCQMEFPSANDLQYHYSSAHPEMKYRCKMCRNDFGRFSAYQKHDCNNRQ